MGSAHKVPRTPSDWTALSHMHFPKSIIANGGGGGQREEGSSALIGQDWQGAAPGEMNNESAPWQPYGQTVGRTGSLEEMRLPLPEERECLLEGQK